MYSKLPSRIILFTQSILLIISGCNSPTHKLEREGKPTIYNVESDDPEMMEAIRRGKSTFPQFMAAITSHDSTIINPAVKVHYDDGVQREFLWVGNLTIENDQLYGIIDNEPEFTQQVKIGQKVIVDTSIVADWNYTQNNRLSGGYTIKLLRNRMPPEERAEFDQSTGLQFDNP